MADELCANNGSLLCLNIQRMISENDNVLKEGFVCLVKIHNIYQI